MRSSRLQRLIGWAWFSSLRRRLAIVAVVAALVTAAVLAYAPVRRAVHGWRAGQLLEEARSRAAAGDWAEAERAARASLQLRDSLGALRLYAQAAGHTGDPQRLRLATALFTHPQAGPEDRVDSVRVFIDANDLLSAAALIRTLDKGDYDPPMRLQIVRFLVKGGQFREAFTLADLEAQSGRGACDLEVVRGLVRTESSEVRAEAPRRLSRVLAAPAREEALEALRLLASLPDHWVHAELARAAVDRFALDRGLSPADQLRVLLFRIALEPEARDELIAAGIESNRGDFETLAGWLLRLGEAERVVALTDGRADLPPALYEQRTSALAALERYDELAAELEHPPPSLPAAVVLAVRAVVENKRGRTPQSVTLWRDAFAAAKLSRGRNDYYRLAAVAERAGDRDRQREALALAVQHPLGVPPPMHQLRDVLQWLYQRGEFGRLLAITDRLLAREPGNPLLLNMHHYLRLLAGPAAENAREVLAQLVKAFPEELAFRSTFALALLKDGAPAEALAQFEEQGADPGSLPPAERAVHAATLAALGRTAEARAQSNSIDWGALPGPEAGALRELLTPGAAAAGFPPPK